MKRWRQHWNILSAREHRLVILGAGAVGVALIYALIWLPWQQRNDAWQRTVTREQQTIDWLRQQAPRVVQAVEPTPGAEASRHLSLPVLISQSSNRHGLKTARLQPQGNQVAVTLARSDFTSLLRWLGELEQQHVAVIQLDVTAVEGLPGSVDISKLVLERRNEN